MIKLIQSTFFNEEQTKKELSTFIAKAGELSFGEESRKFERNFAARQERKDAVFMNSGSSANLAIIQALLNLGRLKKGDQVGFSALTWSTNVMPLIQLGLIPVPIDVELETLNVSATKLQETLKSGPLAALFLTNLLGFCHDPDAIAALCKKEKIILLEDNCESLGTIYKGKKLGNFGLASTNSFYVGHHMSTIEGGMVCTDDKELATMLRIVRAHGWDRNLSEDEQEEIRKRHQVNDFFAKYTFYDLGYNLRPTDIAGFLGNSELRYLDEIFKRRNANFLKVAGAIYSQTDKYFPIKFDHIDFISNFAVPVVCKTKAVHTELIRKCEGKIEIRPIVGGDMTEQPFFAKYVPSYRRPAEKTSAQFIHEHGLYFGNNPQMTEVDLNEIVSVFRNINE